MNAMIALADFKKQWELSRDAYQAAVERVGRSGWLILGKEVAAFEDDLAAYWGLSHAVGCASGLDALELAFRCLGMKPGDLVLTTPLSAFATTLAILRAGGVPVFADVDSSGCIDLNHADAAIGALSTKPRFFVPVHLYGHAMNLNDLEAFSRRHDLLLIEDCAQAIGAKSNGRAVGTISRACATSFYPTKNLGAWGDGGALLTNDAEFARRSRCLRDYGQTEKYVHGEIGMNSRLDELQAALLRSVQLPKLAQQTRRRTEIAQRYRQGIRHAKLALVPPPAHSDSVWHLFPVLVKGDRAAFQQHLATRQVASAVHYPRLIPFQPAMKSVQWHSPVGGGLPRAAEFATSELSLPMHPFLTDDEVQTVIDACNSWEPQ